MLQKRFSGSKWRRSRCHRRPKTTQERRANQDGWCRPSRRPRQLPNAWDDLMRGDIDYRSWKYYRKNQWKPKDECCD